MPEPLVTINTELLHPNPCGCSNCIIHRLTARVAELEAENASLKESCRQWSENYSRVQNLLK